MKIKRYKIRVCYDIAHNFYGEIDEVYVPDVDLFINHEMCFIGGQVNADRVPPEAKEEELGEGGTSLYIVRLANALRDQNSVLADIRRDLFKE